MSIVSSVIAKDRNHGFARFIEEAHTDNLGKVHVVRYFAPVGFDVNARMAVRVAELNAQLAEAEADELLK